MKKVHYHISFENYPGHRVFEVTPHYTLAEAVNFSRDNFAQHENPSIVEAEWDCKHCIKRQEYLTEDRQAMAFYNQDNVVPFRKKG